MKKNVKNGFKNPKISKNFKKYQKITLKNKLKNMNLFFAKKIILGGRDLTRAFQSTLFQNPGGVVRA